MFILDLATAHPAAVALLWPLLTAIVTALFKPPTTAEVVAASGSHQACLSAWQHAVFLAGALGINSQKVIAWVKAVTTPKPPKPPAPPSFHEIKLDEDTDPSIQVVSDPAPAKSVPPVAARIGHFERFAFGFVLVGWIPMAIAITACGLTSGNITNYAPTPEQELGVVSFGGVAEACAYVDASKAEKVACVHEALCESGHAEAGTCDAGATYTDRLVACLHDGGAYVCTSNQDADCACRPKLLIGDGGCSLCRVQEPLDAATDATDGKADAQ